MSNGTTVKKMGRPRRGKLFKLHVDIRESVNRDFREFIGPDRVLARAVEQALINEIRRGRTNG